VPVPGLIFADHQPSDFEHPYAIFDWVEGNSLMDAFASGEDQQDLGIALGKTLAAIGSHHFDRAGSFNPDLTISSEELPPLLNYITDCLIDPGTGLEPSLAAEALAFVHRNGDLLPGPHDAAALVHGDYKAGNILVRRSGVAWDVAAVLDWEFAFAGPPLFDLAPLLRFSEMLQPRFEQGVRLGLEDGGHKLPNDWKRRVRLLDFADLCDFARQPRRGERLVRDVSDLIAATMREWDTYI
jgi:aminoglycoside phosphotransferase (APT) family kinase protein